MRAVVGALVLAGTAAAPQRPVEPGAWAVYRVVTPSGLEVFLRIAGVGDGGGEGRAWLEVEAGLSPSLRSPMVRWVLLVSSATLRSGIHVLRAFAAPGHEPLRELEPSRFTQKTAAVSLGPRALPFGWEVKRRAGVALSTEAGPVKAEAWELRHRGKAVQRLLTSPSIPVLGLAGLELPEEGVRLEVMAFGRGAAFEGPLPPPPPPTAGPEAGFAQGLAP